jgi:hypothetical protein
MSTQKRLARMFQFPGRPKTLGRVERKIGGNKSRSVVRSETNVVESLTMVVSSEVVLVQTCLVLSPSWFNICVI